MYLVYVLLKEGVPEQRSVAIPKHKNHEDLFKYCRKYLREVSRYGEREVTDSRLSSKPIGILEANLWEEYHCC